VRALSVSVPALPPYESGESPVCQGRCPQHRPRPRPPGGPGPRRTGVAGRPAMAGLVEWRASDVAGKRRGGQATWRASDVAGKRRGGPGGVMRGARPVRVRRAQGQAGVRPGGREARRTGWAGLRLGEAGAAREPGAPRGNSPAAGRGAVSHSAARLAGDFCHAYSGMVGKMTRRQPSCAAGGPPMVLQLDLSGKPGMAFVLAPVGLIANHLPLMPWPLRSPGFASAMK
jgi:hypothetical protein